MPGKLKVKTDSQRVKQALKRHAEMQTKKSFWKIHWQVIAEYFLTRKASFTVERVEGAFLNEELFDGTGPDALMKSASAIGSMMWPNGASSIQLVRPNNMPDTEEVKKYYEKISANLVEDMDEPRAGLAIALDEYHIDQVGFGTSGISVMPGKKKTVLQFKAENVKHMSIDEGADGFVDTVYIEHEWPLRRVVKEYGLENLHPDTQKTYRDGKEEDKIRVLFAVQPRQDFEEGKEGVNAMEFESLHIEVEKSHLIKDGGFNDLPIKVARLRKALGEIYGRSFAMSALPDEQELNAVWESVTMCIEKQADPTLIVPEDGIVGGNSIDTSAGAVIVYNVEAAAGRPTKPVDTLPAGEVKDASKLIEVLEKKIASHFLLDRLLDFNNDVEMTLGEANMRNRIRGFLLGSLFARQTGELYDPLVHTSADISFEAGRLGVVENSDKHIELIRKGFGPDEILLIPEVVLKRMGWKKGTPLKRPPFKIKYISPAARMMQAEQAEGIVATLDYAIKTISINPAGGDAINFDAAIKILGFLYGAPSETVNSEEMIKTVRTAREDALRQQQQMQAVQPLADAAKKGAEAHSIMKNANNGGSKGAK